MRPKSAGRGLLARLRSDCPSEPQKERSAIAAHLGELLNSTCLPELETSPLLGLMQSCPQGRLAWQHRLAALLMRYELRLCQLRMRYQAPAPPFPFALHILAQRRAQPSQRLYFIATVNLQGRFLLSIQDDATS